MWTYLGFSALFMHPKALALKEAALKKQVQHIQKG